MILSDNPTSDDFAPLLNDRFEIAWDGTAVTLTLSAVEVRDARHSPPGARRSFSLLFMGPPEPLLPQGTYTWRNETLGALELFAVPLGPGDGGQRYEVIFN